MKIRVVEGITEITSKGEIVFHTFDGSAEFNAKGKNIWVAPNTFIGEYEEVELDSDNSYIPVVNIDEVQNSSNKVQTNGNKEWTLSIYIQQSLRKPKSKNIKFISEDKIVKVKLNVIKGNPTANDSDGGNITAKFYDVDDKFIESKVFKNLKYGDSFEVEWDKSKKIGQISFYADDNDWIFDGGVKNVFCGAIKYGSKVGRTLTKNIEGLPIAKLGEHLPATDEYTFGHPQESIDIANKYQNCLGMCFAVSMARVGKAFEDCKITDAIKITTKGDDYIYSGTISKNIPDDYFGYGVGGALAKNEYAELLTHEEVWGGKLEEGAMIQFWRNKKLTNWETLKKSIKNSLSKINDGYFSYGHSVIFKSYVYDKNNKIAQIRYYDYHGIGEELVFENNNERILLGANLKDEK
ncbi:hypothetical protein ACM39_16780 [Chryseobacterium sp. FH2]|uniref:hypothetical protein n=1 Tax=Chryseobacterium sp. FH2 TaxID=1674291 RepID=UPI00065ABEFA|nr:hypothetical protein [Chryseobacterium sp. FH2]KMQ65327.1 hypothetical protein ACM39_16780 [Chryseobacterium sp. FH2]